MRSIYTLVSDNSSPFDKIEEIPKRTILENKISYCLFTLNELIKLYPVFRITGEYIIFSESLLINYKNYLLLEQLYTNRSGGISSNNKFCITTEVTKDMLIEGNDSKLRHCFFLKYPFQDVYINSGIYVYNWMIKKIKRVSSRRWLYSKKLDNAIVIENSSMENSITETPDGLILNF